MREVEHITKEAAAEALREAAFTSEVDGRTTVHSFLGGIGADHDLDAALAKIEASDDCAWADHLIGHELAVLVDGRVYRYDVRRPALVEEDEAR